VEQALKKFERSTGGRTPSSELFTSVPIDDDVEAALMVLSKHATRLGVTESDILMAMISPDEVEPGESLMDESMLARELSTTPHRPAGMKNMSR
jgi:hypothetical protein